MTLLLISPLRLWVLKAQYWLALHDQYWLAAHLPQIVRWTFGFLPIALLIGEYIREIFWIWKVPNRANQLAGRGESDRAITLMRRSVGAFTPLLGSRLLHLKRLYSLGLMLEAARRIGEANEVWEEILKRPGPTTIFESDVRRRLADNLETLGDTSTATRQRALREDRLKQGESKEGAGHWSILLERGKSAADGNRYAEATELLERALSAPKTGILRSKRGSVDVEIAAHLALSAYQSGNISRAESAARFVIAEAHTPFWRGQGYRALALTLGTQNRLPEALEASAAALHEIEKEQNPDLLAHGRSNHALLLMMYGQVRQALAECKAIAQMGTVSSCTALHNASNCALFLGDYEGARSWLDQARRSAPFSSPAAERQRQGLYDVESANVETAATRKGGEMRAQVAWDLLQRAKPNLNGFDRLLYWASTSETLVLALLGQKEAARARLETIEAQLCHYEDDVATQNAVWWWLALINMELGEWSAAEKWWRTYLDSGQARPVFLPGSLCELGLCLRAQNDEAGARVCWQQAVDMGLDIVDTARACQLLELN